MQTRGFFILNTFLVCSLFSKSFCAVYDKPSSCPSGTRLFELPDGSKDCLYCTVCPAGQVEKRPCSANHDTVCECVDNTFFNTMANRCVKCATCPAGQYVTRACSHAADVACATCPQGSTTKGQNSECCQLNCSAGVEGKADDCPVISPAVCKSNSTETKSEDVPITNSGAGDGTENNISVSVIIISIIIPISVVLLVILLVIYRYRQDRCSIDKVLTLCGCKPHEEKNEADQAGSSRPDDHHLEQWANVNASLIDETPHQGTSMNASNMSGTETPDKHGGTTEPHTPEEDKLLKYGNEYPPEPDLDMSETSQVSMASPTHGDKSGNFLDSLKECEKSVGALVHRCQVLTVFRVGEKYAMTSYTAFKQFCGSSSERVPYDARVTFRQDPKVDATYRLSSRQEYKDMLNDIIILKFVQSEGLPAPLTLWNGVIPADGEFGFVDYTDYHQRKRRLPSGFLVSHESMEWKSSKSYIEKEKSRIEEKLNFVGKNKDLVEESLKELQNESQVLLRQRSLPGGKGSPCFLKNNDRAVVALMYSHTVPLFYEELLTKSVYRGRLFLTGPTMSDVYKEMKSTNPQLTQEIFGT